MARRRNVEQIATLEMIDLKPPPITCLHEVTLILKQNLEVNGLLARLSVVLDVVVVFYMMRDVLWRLWKMSFLDTLYDNCKIEREM